MEIYENEIYVGTCVVSLFVGCYYLFNILIIFYNFCHKMRIENIRNNSKLNDLVFQLENKIINLEHKIINLETNIISKKNKNDDTTFIFETQMSKKGYILNNSINFGVTELHMVYNKSDLNLYGIVITNCLDGYYDKDEIYFNNLNEYIKEEDYANNRPFYVGLDKIIRYELDYPISYKISIITDFFKKFHSLKQLVIHQTDKVDLLKINVCMFPLMDSLKTLGFEIVIYHKSEDGFIKKKL